MDDQGAEKRAELIEQWVKEGVKKALREHKLMGRPIWVARGDKVLKVEPEDIDV